MGMGNMDIGNWISTCLGWGKSIVSWAKKWFTAQGLCGNYIPDTFDKTIERLVGQESKESKAMTLGDKQRKFSLMVAKLITYMYEEGYEVTLGDAWAHDGHSKNSLHYKRLAIDLNLFKSGKYLTETSDHEPFGEYWESLGGSWGGRFNDGNHYSLEHNGYK
jgi:hypothetical protein